MKKCVKCGRYTLSDRCPLCNSKAVAAHPPRFSAADRFGKYRRMARVRKDGNNDKHY